MQGFGNLDKFDELKSQTEAVEKDDILKFDYSEEEQTKLDNVRVPVLENNVYVNETKTESVVVPLEEEEKTTGGSGNKEETPEKEKQKGAAGTSEEKEEEPIMGSLGVGVGGLGGKIKKEMSRMEGFTPDETVDEEPMDSARDQFQDNTNDKVKSIFNDMYDDKFSKAKHKDYDLDATVIKSKVSTEPIKKIPTGW